MTGYVTTLTGRKISEGAGTPSLLDIAVGLSRITRFAGQGKMFFSVLAHSLWMHDWAAKQQKDEATRLAILLHDAHESVTSDIPSPLKMLDQRTLQYTLDQRIFDRYFAGYGGYEAYCDREVDPYQTVKALDYHALLTEYWSVGPASECYLGKPPAEYSEFFSAWCRQYSGWSAAGGPGAAPVQQYIKLLSTLL